VFQTVLRYKYDTPLQLLVAPVVETLEDDWPWQDKDVFTRLCFTNTLRVGVYETNLQGSPLEELPRAIQPGLEIPGLPVRGFQNEQQIFEFAVEHPWVQDCYSWLQMCMDRCMPRGEETNTKTRAVEMFNKMLLVVREYETSAALGVENKRRLAFQFLKDMVTSFTNSVEHQGRFKLHKSVDSIVPSIKQMFQEQFNLFSRELHSRVDVVPDPYAAPPQGFDDSNGLPGRSNVAIQQTGILYDTSAFPHGANQYDHRQTNFAADPASEVVTGHHASAQINMSHTTFGTQEAGPSQTPVVHATYTGSYMSEAQCPDLNTFNRMVLPTSVQRHPDEIQHSDQPQSSGGQQPSLQTLLPHFFENHPQYYSAGPSR
jgi:hypothetical protein